MRESNLALGGCISFVLLYVFFASYFYRWSSLSQAASSGNPSEPHRQQQQQQRLRQEKQNPAALSDTLGCLAAECIRSEASKLARVYPRRRDRHHWCLTKRDGDNDDDRYRGLLLVKIPKAASSTSAGIVLRLAHRMNCAQYQWMHRPAVEYKADKVHPVNSFLFTSIRDPGQRAVSSIFFHVLSRDAHLEPTDHTLLHYLQHSTSSHYGAQSDGQGGFQLRYASFHEIPKQSAWMAADPTTVINPELVASNVRQALQGYGFVLVTERMDESLVAMALLLGIDVGDVLVTASKVAGSTYHLVKPAGKDLECLPTLKVCLCETQEMGKRSRCFDMAE